MNLARLLARGVGAWLHFEQTSNRSGLFSEKYLALPIGQILSGQLGTRAVAEYRHPVLAPIMIGQGKRPAVDFVVFGKNREIKVAVESKWLGPTAPDVKAILWDLVRLEMIAHTEGADCFFVLGGRKERLDALFLHQKFAGNPTWHPHPLIEYRSNTRHRVHLLPLASHRNAMLKAMFEDYQDFLFPHDIVTTRSAPFPENCNLSLPQVYVWRISCAENRRTFAPKAINAYRT
jgi:hypothetical protein